MDFETATNRYDSACSIGIAAVKDNKIVDTFYSLLKPPTDNFDPDMIQIHGITPNMVKDSPSLIDIWRDIYHFFCGNLVIAHNAHFDMSVLKQSLSYIQPFNFKYVDSISIAKDFVSGSKSLANCAEELGIHLGNHHNALDDAISCANVVLCCLDRSGYSNIGQLCFALDNVKIHSVDDLNPSETMHSSKSRKSHVPAYAKVSSKDILPATNHLSCDHPLYHKNVVFTGELSIDRRTAMQMVVDVGAVVKSGISRSVHYLIIGEQDLDIVGDDGRSSKEKRAYELNESGKADIKIIHEAEFLNLVGSVR